MIDAPHPTAADRETGKPESVLAASLDTTAGSVIHYIFGYLGRVGFGGQFARTKLYVASVAITFLPLFIGASLSPLSFTVRNGTLKLPFLYDVNNMFAFLVSFPCLIILTATDQQILADALKSVQADGTIEIPDEDQYRLAALWTEYFRNWNWAAQALGAICGGIIAYLNYCTYVRPGFGFWITQNDNLLPVGYIYLYCIFLFYAVVAAYVVRNLVISWLLRDVVKSAKVHMLPLHPDKAGGLLPVGRLGLRNQYALSLVGVNVALLLTISIVFLGGEDPLLIVLMGAAVVAYLVLGPAVFMAPLLPFRNAMLKNKRCLMSEAALRIRLELDRLRQQWPEVPISKDNEELIERLRKLGTMIYELPVWPFDAETQRKFLTAYIIPIVTASYPIATTVVSFIKKAFFS